MKHNSCNFINLSIYYSSIVLSCLLFYENTYCRENDALTSQVVSENKDSLVGTWIKQNPNFNLGSIFTMFFSDSSVGWAAGSGETFYKTEDGGISWAAYQCDEVLSATWLDIQFIDPQKGWISGSTIIHTKDGGLTWKVQVSNTNARSVCFTDSLNGWAVGENFYLKTTDGGENWNLHQLNGYSLYDVFFVDSLTGWMVGDSSLNQIILKTTDGGVHWFPQFSDTEGQLKSVFFLNDTIGLASGYNFIIRTTNGGETWSYQKISYPENGEDFQSIRFVNDNTGYCLGKDGGNSGSAIYRTSDGGITWSKVSQTTFKSTNTLQSIFFADEKTGWAAGSHYDFYDTKDGGVTWQNLANTTNEYLFSVHAFNASVGLAVGNTETIISTENAGEEWELKHSTDYGADFYDIAFSDSENGWITLCKYGYIYKTTDGGDTWKKVKVSDYNAVHGLQFFDAKTGWAVGGNVVSRTTYKTTDGGDSWVLKNCPSGGALMNLYFIDSLTGWAVGYKGTILKTEDGGENWVSQNSTTTKWLESTFFINKDKGFAVGEEIILRTSDGGNKWDSLLGVNGWIEDICFMDEKHGFAVGVGVPEGGYISKTMYSEGRISMYGGSAKVWVTGDGGNTWMDSTLEGDWLLDIDLTDLNSGWTVGRGGIIFKYNNNYNIPLSPSGLSASVISGTEIRLNWEDRSDNENGFAVFRRVGSEGSFRQIAAVGPSVTTYADNTVILNGEYWYRIRAFNETGNSSYTSDVFVKLTSPLNAPDLIDPSDGSTGQPIEISLSWNTVSLAENYNLQVDSLIDFSSPVIDQTGITGSPFMVSNLVNYTEYFWRVSAANSLGTGPWSETWSFITMGANVKNSSPFIDKLRIYPIPATDKLFIEGIEDEDALFLLYSHDGKLLQQVRADEKKEIDLSHMQKGFYIIQIIYSGGSVTFKLMKE